MKGRGGSAGLTKQSKFFHGKSLRTANERIEHVVVVVPDDVDTSHDCLYRGGRGCAHEHAAREG